MRLFKAVTLTAILSLLGLQPVIAADADATIVGEEQEESALQQSIRLRERIELISEELARLESEFSPYDYRLQESLQALTDVYLEIGDFQQAGSILERRLQLVRTTEGPASMLQLPIIDELIANDIRLSDWNSVTDRFEFVQFLHSQDDDVDAESRLQAKNDLAMWNLSMVYLLEPPRRIRAFRAARAEIRENTRLAEELYGEDSMESVAWLYQEAVLQYQIAAVLLAEDELGVYARDEILYMEGRSVESYLREGLNLLKRIREIAEEQGNLETVAMAMTYEADFQMLLELGTAARLYRQAMDKFAEAGLSREQVDGFFQRPVILPVPEFHTRLEDAIGNQEAVGFQILTAQDGENSMHLGTFVAWSDSLPYAHRPDLPAAAADLEAALNYDQIEMTFTLNSRGTTRNPKITESTTDSSRYRSNAREALRDMQFRPFFEGGRWRRTENLSISYLILPD